MTAPPAAPAALPRSIAPSGEVRHRVRGTRLIIEERASPPRGSNASGRPRGRPDPRLSNAICARATTPGGGRSAAARVIAAVAAGVARPCADLAAAALGALHRVLPDVEERRLA